MRNVPIFFSFDRNMVIPAGVCITSLLQNAHADTFYDIFILCSESTLPEADRSKVGRLSEIYDSRCRITFVETGNAFQGAYEVRDITESTYNRLLIPRLLPELNARYSTNYTTVIYLDVDIIVECDLSELPERCAAQPDKWIFGVCESPLLTNPSADVSYFESIGADPSGYINAGVLVMNAQEMNAVGFTDKCLAHKDRKYEFQDQDIINIVARGHIGQLPLKYNFTSGLYTVTLENPAFAERFSEEIKDARHGVIHYTGIKPWKGMCIRFEQWWYYFRCSIYRDDSYYKAYYDSLPKLLFKDEEIRKKLFKLVKKWLKYKLMPWQKKYARFWNS